jgi:hypothetical protein
MWFTELLHPCKSIAIRTIGIKKILQNMRLPYNPQRNEIILFILAMLFR